MMFNDNLNKYRKQKGLSQEELAFRLGVSRQSVSKWESGQSTPELERIIEIADLFGISLDELIGHESNDYIDRCPSFIELNCNGQDYVLIHAGINPEKGLYEQTEEECAWMREYFFMSKGLDNKIIIFGHTPTCYIHQASGCFDVWYDPVFKDKIGIDGGLGPFDKGQLNCLCLNTQEVFVIKKSELAIQE